MNWLTKFLKAPREIGSVAASSPALGKLMTKNIKPTSTVLELGPGNGAITKHLISRLNDPSQLLLVESDAEFAQACHNKFPGTTVLNDDAENILSRQDLAIDHIVSGIPFAGMTADKRARMFKLIRERLAPGGTFIMFQYSILTRGELKKLFGEVKTDFTLFNIPPAFVFTCSIKEKS